jgi:hypothetical protein
VPTTKPEVTETFSAFGHMNLRATHKSTLEFTKETYLTREGDCIIATASEKSVADLSPEVKECLRKPNAKLTVRIEADSVVDEIHAFGSPRLLLSHSKDIVMRKSDYVCSRTLAIGADKAAVDLSRELIKKLKDPKHEATIMLRVKC